MKVVDLPEEELIVLHKNAKDLYDTYIKLGSVNFIKFDDQKAMQENMYRGLSVNWKHVMDFAATKPQYERVKNYISFINE